MKTETPESDKPLCNALPQTIDMLDELARKAGYSSLETVANEHSLWSAPVRDVISHLTACGDEPEE